MGIAMIYFRFKLLRWWSQSFLLGVPQIIVGFRDDNGLVKSLKTYKTLEIPNLVKVIPSQAQTQIFAIL
jgi:RAT1-interacting protein